MTKHEDGTGPVVVDSPVDRGVRRLLVTHKQVYRRGPFGGTLNTTLCGRMASGDDINSDTAEARVTCVLCLGRLRLLTPNVELSGLPARSNDE